MYRYSADNAVTYASEDFVLFRESPFACWMERLSLENPDHGIAPDTGSVPPCHGARRQDELADTLHAEGKNVQLIDWEADEADRRCATIDAMRRGTDFIVNGQLAVGPLSGVANLLVRTSGYSDLGDFLYIPCDTQAGVDPNAAFRLCFLADLLHSLQGQLPPQMLIVSDGDGLSALQTERHIYHYRAVKQRFMQAMRGFRKHRMPDPVESSHFGRWSDCAHALLKQRLLREQEQEQGEDSAGVEYIESVRRAAGSHVGEGATNYDPDHNRRAGDHGPGAVVSVVPAGDTGAARLVAPAQLTLVEQARLLKPGTYKPGPGVYRLGRPRTAVPAAEPAPGQAPGTPAAPEKSGYNRRASDAVPRKPDVMGSYGLQRETDVATAPAAGMPFLGGMPPAPSLRDPRGRLPANARSETMPRPVADLLPGREATVAVPPNGTSCASLAPASALGTFLPEQVERSASDGSSQVTSPPPRLATASAVSSMDAIFEGLELAHGSGPSARDDSQHLRSGLLGDTMPWDAAGAGGGREVNAFSSSLITSDDFNN